MTTCVANCPLEVAIRITGGRWRLILIYCLLNGPKRFSDLEREIPGISQRMLTLDLRKLEQAGIISRKIIADVPVKVEYQLTPEGLELQSVVNGLRLWGQQIIERQRAEKIPNATPMTSV
jgi:DNA-binding HxlR family transcriptional regulator